MFARVAGPILAVFVVANLLGLALVEATRLGDVPVDVQTRLIYRARVDAFFDRAAGAHVAMLGDSLVYGGHLAEREGPGWPRKALPAQLERVARTRSARWSVLNLGIDGVLYGDLHCVVDDILARRPEALVINLSPRPFSTDFTTGENESGRAFLCAQPPHGVLDTLAQAVGEFAYDFVPAYRFRDLLQFRALGTTPRAFVVDSILTALGHVGPDTNASGVDDEEDEAEDQALLAEMMQRLRAAQRYNSLDVSDSHPQAGELAALLRSLGAQRRTRVLVFYLKENTSVIAAQLDLAHYAESTGRFVERVQGGLAGAERARFVAIDSADFAGQYVDHIHLTPAGYARLAARLFDELPP